MKKALLWLGIALPWITGVTVVVVFCLHEYHEGRVFTHGLHSFRWILYIFAGLVGLLTALQIAIWVVVANRDYFREPPRRGCIILILGTSFVVPLFGVVVVPKFFNAGRDAAYRSVDYEAVYDACKQLAASIPEPGKILFFGVGGPDARDLADLPAAIRQLSPRFVHAESDAVAIQMDGGGPMYHEGIGVILAADSRKSEKCLAHCRQNLEYCRRLHDGLPVVLYRLYDYRVFLDQVGESMNNEQWPPAELSSAPTP
jgi:hypothetical protein